MRFSLNELAIVALMFSLVGCAGPFGMTGMSADQLKEWVKVKDANATCVRGVYAGALFTAVSVSVDKGIPAGVTIDENCKATITVVPAAK
jgi:hypothetical protein